jgi:glycosyltransferase involved in cell wall biosynthesis
MLSISFCTTCMNRTHHLKVTLPHNLHHVAAFWPNCDITLLNYNSSDDLDPWILKTFKSEIKFGILRYFRTTEPKFFRMSHAKNAAHLLSKGDILFNLDADNFIDSGLIEHLSESFRKDKDILLRGHEFFGVGGRIALTRSNFFELNGYNESFVGWGEDDLELIDRARSLGLKVRTMKQFDRCLDHCNKERLAFMPPDSSLDMSAIDASEYAHVHGLATNRDLNGMWLKNYLIRKAGIRRLDHKVNIGHEWGKLNPKFMTAHIADDHFIVPQVKTPNLGRTAFRH